MSKPSSFLTLALTGFVATGLAIWAAAPAPAQVFASHNSNAPVNFEASRFVIEDRADRVTLLGPVRIEQAGLVLNAARMTVAYTQSGGIEIDRIDASGGVDVRRGSDRAQGEVAIYDLDRRLITLIGNVTLTQNANVLRGGRVIIDLNSGRATIDGRATGGDSAPGVSGGASGRVSGTFTVPQRGN